MTKYRLMKEVNYINGKSFFYIEKRHLFFLWAFVPGTLTADLETGKMFLDNVRNHAKSTITKIA